MVDASIIPWEELYKQYPEIFGSVKQSGGKYIVKLIHAKLKEGYPRIKEFLKSKRIGSDSQVLLNSETKKYLDLMAINFNEENKLVKKYIKTDDWSIYLLARKALEEKNNYNAEEVKKIKGEARQLAGTRGGRLINFVLQGYFEEIFIPLLKYQIEKLKTYSKIFTWFNKFIDNQIIFP